MFLILPYNMPKFNSSTHKMKSPVIYLSAKIWLQVAAHRGKLKLEKNGMGFDMKEEYSFYNILTGKPNPKTEATSILQRHWVEEAELNEVLMQIIMEQRKKGQNRVVVRRHMARREMIRTGQVFHPEEMPLRFTCRSAHYLHRRHVTCIWCSRNRQKRLCCLKCLFGLKTIPWIIPSFRVLCCVKPFFMSSHMGEPLILSRFRAIEWIIQIHFWTEAGFS